MLSLKDAAKSYLAERRKSFAHDRSLTVGASEISLCAQRVWREKKLGPEAYDPTYKPAEGAAFRGDLLEKHYTTEVVKHWLAKRAPQAELIWATDEQHTIQALEWRMSATPDGMVINAPRDILAEEGVSDILTAQLVVEMKSFDPRIGDALPKQAHLDQANVQLGLIRKEGTHEPHFAIVVYVNASFPDDIRVFPVFFDKLAFENQIRRALQIMGANDVQQLRPEGKVAGEKECGYCPFAAQCLGYVPNVPNPTREYEKAPPGKKQRIMSLAGRIDSQKKQRDIYQRAIDEAEAELKEALADAKLNRATGPMVDGRTFTIDWSTTRPRTTWDSDALTTLLKSQGIDPWDYQKEGKPSERLTVRMFGNKRNDTDG